MCCHTNSIRYNRYEYNAINDRCWSPFLYTTCSTDASIVHRCPKRCHYLFYFDYRSTCVVGFHREDTSRWGEGGGRFGHGISTRTTFEESRRSPRQLSEGRLVRECDITMSRDRTRRRYENNPSPPSLQQHLVNFQWFTCRISSSSSVGSRPSGISRLKCSRTSLSNGSQERAAAQQHHVSVAASRYRLRHTLAKAPCSNVLHCKS